MSDNPTKNPPCPFCNYAGPSPILRDESGAQGYIVIEPLNPVVPGHVLVIPKLHVPDAPSNPRIAGEAMYVAASWAQDKLRDVDCNIITSAGDAATQTVRHLHVHVVPRRSGDGLMLPWSDSFRE